MTPEYHAAWVRRYRRQHPAKLIAQSRLNYVLRRGYIQRQPCESCGTSHLVHACHVSTDPKDWYRVRWLCVPCKKLKLIGLMRLAPPAPSYVRGKRARQECV